MADEPRGFRAAKCFEGNGPLAVWSVSARGPDGQARKFHLIADASQSRFGVRTEAERTDDVKVNGAVVTLLRKHARTPGIGRIFRDPASGHIWIPLFTSRGERPDFWVELARTAPPELRFLDAAGESLVRKSSQGVYTKRRTAEGPPPAYPPAPGMEDLTDALLASTLAFPSRRAAAPVDEGPAHGAPTPDHNTSGWSAAPARASPAPSLPGSASPAPSVPGSASPAPSVTDSASPTPSVPGGASSPSVGGGPPAPAGGDALPIYQRDARDRLARRLKTVGKALAKLGGQSAAAGREAQLTRQARLLQEHLHEVSPGADHLRVAGPEGVEDIALDPDLSPGQNLAGLYHEVKRCRRAGSVVGAQAAGAQRELAAMTADLAALRQGALARDAVEAILRRHRLPLTRQDGGVGGADPAALPYRTYYWRPDGESTGKPVTVLVGKSAGGSDELCRLAKSNDHWLHAAGTTGSHVIIPARQLAGSPADSLLQAAGVLALHYSKRRDDRRGEVYVSRRSHIKKRKGMPPGLWVVEKAETRYLTYTEADLHRLLAMTQP